MKKRDNTESFPFEDNPFPFEGYKTFLFEGHITFITLDISYSNDKKVRIRKIHKDIETEELKKSKYKIDGNESYIYDNQIDLDMFYYNPDKNIHSTLGRKSFDNIKKTIKS